MRDSPRSMAQTSKTTPDNLIQTWPGRSNAAFPCVGWRWPPALAQVQLSEPHSPNSFASLTFCWRRPFPVLPGPLCNSAQRRSMEKKQALGLTPPSRLSSITRAFQQFQSPAAATRVGCRSEFRSSREGDKTGCCCVRQCASRLRYNHDRSRVSLNAVRVDQVASRREEMAGDTTLGAGLFQQRQFNPASLHRERAARVKTAAGRWIEQARHFTSHDRMADKIRVRTRH